MGVASSRGPNHPVLVLHRDDQAAKTPAPGHVTQPAEALTYADGVAAPTWISTVPLGQARVPLPRGLVQNLDPKLPRELKPQSGIKFGAPF